MAIKNPHLTSEELVQAAKFLHARDFGPDALKLLREVISQNRTSDLVKNLVHEGGLYGLNYEDSAARAEWDLEALAREEELIACILMARLYPITSSIIGMHQESDAINICIGECKRPELLEQLELMALEETDSEVKGWYEMWIKSKKSGPG